MKIFSSALLLGSLLCANALSDDPALSVPAAPAGQQCFQAKTCQLFSFGGCASYNYQTVCGVNCQATDVCQVYGSSGCTSYATFVSCAGGSRIVRSPVQNSR
jgi:hypothetical protein